MMRGLPLAFFAALAVMTPAFAASVAFSVHTGDGRAAEDAVVELTRLDGSAITSGIKAETAEIDQHDLTFVPSVTVIQQGGRVIFANHDTTMHQVYSFSPIKRFEFKVAQGKQSDPVMFARTGVAAIGCNIHDHMAAFVYVAESRLVSVTDKHGQGVVKDVPPGKYRITVWHPLLPPAEPWPAFALDVGEASQAKALTISLLPGDLPGKKPMHMQAY